MVGAAMHHVRCPNERINTLCWMKSTDFILATGGNFGQVSLWDIRLFSELKIIQFRTFRSGHCKLAQFNLSSGSKSSNNEIRDISATNDGEFFISLTKSGKIQLFDASTIKELSSHQVHKFIFKNIMKF
jgi:WD40 repeat protein